MFVVCDPRLIQQARTINRIHRELLWLSFMNVMYFPEEEEDCGGGRQGDWEGSRMVEEEVGPSWKKYVYVSTGRIV